MALYPVIKGVVIVEKHKILFIGSAAEKERAVDNSTKKILLSVRLRCSKQRSNLEKISCVGGLPPCCLAEPPGTLQVPEWRSCHYFRFTVCTEAQLMLSCNCFLNAENSNKAHMHACTYMLTAMLRLMEILQIANPVWNQKLPTKTSAHLFGQQS